MKDLIERLEKATEGSRELSRLIHFHVVHPWLAVRCVKWVDAAFEAEGSFLWWDAERLAAGKEGYSDAWEPYATSFDAALTLVPEGWPMRLSAIRFGLWRVELLNGDKSFAGKPDVDVAAETPAFALCIAALRARSGSQ